MKRKLLYTIAVLISAISMTACGSECDSAPVPVATYNQKETTDALHETEEVDVVAEEENLQKKSILLRRMY